MQAALYSEIGKPELTILSDRISTKDVDLMRMTYRSTTSHGAQKAVVNFDDLLHSLAGNPISRRSSRICAHNNTALKSES